MHQQLPHLPDVLNRIKSSTVPWVAALHGAVLGGGAEWRWCAVTVWPE